MAFCGGGNSPSNSTSATASNSFSSSPGSPNPGPGVPLAPNGPAPTSTNVDPSTIGNPPSLLDQFIKAKTAIAGMQGGGGGASPALGFSSNTPTNIGSAGMATPGLNIPLMNDPGASKYAQGGGGLHQMMGGAGKSGNL